MDGVKTVRIFPMISLGLPTPKIECNSNTIRSLYQNLPFPTGINFGRKTNSRRIRGTLLRVSGEFSGIGLRVLLSQLQENQQEALCDGGWWCR